MARSGTGAMDRAAARRWIALDRAVNAAERAANRNVMMKTPASAASRAASKSLRSVLGAAENVLDKDLELLVLNLNLTVEQMNAMVEILEDKKRRQERAQPVTLLSGADVPQHMRLEFIHGGYRKPSHPWPLFVSAFWPLHNETGNIWSEVFSILWLTRLWLSLGNPPHRPAGDTAALVLLLLTVLVGHFFSLIYHTFMPLEYGEASKAEPDFWFWGLRSLDYLGIFISGWGQAASFAYFAFHPCTNARTLTVWHFHCFLLLVCPESALNQHTTP